MKMKITTMSRGNTIESQLVLMKRKFITREATRKSETTKIV